MIVKESDYLAHEGRSKRDGAPVGSGRYPLGSGENPYQDYRDFKNLVAQIKKRYRDANGTNITDKELITYLYDDYGPMTIREYREMITKSNAEITAADYRRAKMLKEERQWSDKAIAKELGRSESNVRDLLKRDADLKSKRINTTAELLKESLDKQGGFIDVGAYAEMYMHVGESNLKAAVRQLEFEGYTIQKLSVRQMFGQGNTTLKLICPPGTTKSEVYQNMGKIRLPVDLKVNEAGDKVGLRPVENVKSKRVMIKYAEEGGIDKDGVIELRRGVKDLDLGQSKYAQVRISVDGTHYLKGMAVYADDLPDGIDIRFNTNKKLGTPMEKVLKPMADPKNLTNPFGASITSQRGALNIVNEEGDWAKWSRNLASQFLSKQHEQTAKKQLKATADIAKAEFDEIKALNNPTLKRYFLQQFANSCDADAVNLKAVRLPGQSQKVLLPLPEIKRNEIYCPTLNNGEQVALVRYPHGGIFEIPVLTVNNKNKTAERIFGNARDAVGIHPSVASVLSGADFDGDSVMVLPTKSFKLKRSDPLPGLKGFEPKITYNGDHLAAKDKMKKGNVQSEMGTISNLITDMTIQHAEPEELARAVRHSMVVIDAYKHGLDYKASARDNKIDELKRKYQTGGASTLISRAKSQYYYEDRREKAVSKLTSEERARWEKGEIIWEPTGKTVYTKKGPKLQTHRGTRMGETKDAYELSSGTTMEKYYADYANQMKALANEARAELRRTPKIEYSPAARKLYEKEVASLSEKLKTAQMNAPLERKAQALAQSTFLVEKNDHPEYDESQIKKAKSRHLEAARNAVGAGKKKIEITDKEWEAIQAGAISDTRASKIFENTDTKLMRQRAMPKDVSIAPAKLARAKTLKNSNYTWAEIAEILGVSVSTLQKALD